MCNSDSTQNMTTRLQSSASLRKNYAAYLCMLHELKTLQLSDEDICYARYSF